MGCYLGQKELPEKKVSYFHIIVLADEQLRWCHWELGFAVWKRGETNG